MADNLLNRLNSKKYTPMNRLINIRVCFRSFGTFFILVKKTNKKHSTSSSTPTNFTRHLRLFPYILNL